MKEERQKVQSDVDEKMDYVEPVLIRFDEREKFSVGMCGVGVTGAVTGDPVPCWPGGLATGGGCISGGTP